MRVRLSGMLLCAIAAFLSSQPVNAAPVSIGDQITVRLPNGGYSPTASVNVTVSGVKSYSGSAGVFNWDVQSTNPSGLQSELPDPLIAFCIELTQHVGYNNNYTYTIKAVEDAPLPGSNPIPGTSGMGAVKAAHLTELYDRFYTDSPTDALYTSGTEAAAFQLAIWEIVYEDIDTYSFNLGTGDFYSNKAPTNAATVRANEMLGALSGSFFRSWDLFAMSNNSRQDHLIAFEREITTTGEPIPTPAAAGLGLPLLGLLGITRPSRRRTG